MLTCSVEVDLQIPLTGSSDNTDKCIKVRQKTDGVYEDKCFIYERFCVECKFEKKNLKRK